LPKFFSYPLSTLRGEGEGEGEKKELLATSIRIKMRRKDAEHRRGQIFGSITSG
jgi:hypothetical protein